MRVYDLDMIEVKTWYDGYELRYRDRGGGGVQRGIHVVNAYAPYSVMMACDDGTVGSFWPSTEAYETVLPYIELDLDGLQGKVVDLVSGNPVHINPDAFRNDIQAVRSADEVLTLLCHLGYLTFDEQTSTVRVPNEEVRSELAIAVTNSTNVELVHRMQASRDLLARLIAMDEQAVADGISEAHERECTPLFYNNEQALRAVVKSALVATVDSYGRFEELASGHGFADICYIPKAGVLMPSILVELKWNQPVEAAITQIKNKGYYKGVTDLGYPLLLVGITYESDTDERRHTCRIEIWRDRGKANA